MYTLIIFVPDKLKSNKNSGYLLGNVKIVKNDINFYIIDKIISISELPLTNEELMIIGFDSVDKIKPNNKINFCTPNFISIRQSDAEEWHICIQDVKLRNRMLSSSIQPIVVYYDYNAFLIAYIDNNNFETSKSSVKPYDHFATLSEFIKARKHEQTKRINNHGPAELIKKLVLQIFFISLLYISRFLNSVSIIGKYSAFYRNLKECINGIVEIHENGAKYDFISKYKLLTVSISTIILLLIDCNSVVFL